MRRAIGSRDYLNIRTYSLDDGDVETVLTPLACMVRVKCTSVATGATLLYRGVADLAGVEGVPDPADTDPLDARTVKTRIRNAVLNADAPRFNLWGI
jgi:hypothetical protein